ncbi:MAG: hypothetical protein WBK77_00120 [Alphaproteobacteria bacterium]
MSLSVHQRIRILIEQTNDAFTCYDTVNADFAEFATLALSDFKEALENPHLTRSQLTRMLRRGMTKHRDKTPGSWSAFMAAHVAKAANVDTPVEGRFYRRVETEQA